MIYSCRYNQRSGRIFAWRKGNCIQHLQALACESNSLNFGDSFGIVSKVPQEVLEHSEPWALQNLRVRDVNANGSVEVEWTKKKMH